jgi:DNA-binding Lrp family transcriptional regulator
MKAEISDLHFSSEAFAESAVEQSRTAILTQMQKLGIHVEALESLTINQLSDLLYGMHKLIDSSKERSGREQPPRQRLVLSEVDKKILKTLLQTEGRVSMISLSKDLKIPLTTLLRRKKKMDDLLQINYSLNYEKLELKQVTFLVSTEGQQAADVKAQVLSIPGIHRLVQVLGNGIDLRADAVLKTNEEIAKLSDRIRGIAGVRNVIWMESLKVLEDNRNANLQLVDSM